MEVTNGIAHARASLQVGTRGLLADHCKRQSADDDGDDHEHHEAEQLPQTKKTLPLFSTAHQIVRHC